MRTAFKSASSVSRIVGLALLAATAFQTSSRGAVISQAGEQDFNDGYLLTSANGFNDAAAGEPAPFEHSHGSDGGPSLSESWTQTYVAGSYTGATFTLGILDHDSQAPGNQVAYFGVDGRDVTGLLSAQFKSFGGRQGECNIYSITLPGVVLADLADGTAAFQLTLQGPGLGGTTLNPTPTPENGAGLDFARLTLLVPEPGTVLLMSVASVPLVVRTRRTRSS